MSVVPPIFFRNKRLITGSAIVFFILGGILFTRTVSNTSLSFRLGALGAGVGSGNNYYVDAVNGNDTWSGKYPDPQGSTNGPWRTLAKVSTAAFGPGDNIFLRCGSVWRESLMVPKLASGSLYVGSYGACNGTNKPLITGADAVAGWTPYAGNIYSAPLMSANVTQVFADGAPLAIAHYPNRGYLPAQPTSVYLTMPQDSALANPPGPNGDGSNSFVAGSDLALSSAEVNGMVGAGVHIRTNNYLVDDRTITSYDPATKRITLDKPTSHQLAAGWGYYLDNKLWMLNQPGEWYYDTVTQKLYVWMPDGSNPGGRVETSVRDIGVSVRAGTAVTVDGLSIQKAKTGVDLNYARNVTVRNTDILYSGLYGIDMSGSYGLAIDGSTIDQSMHNGIYGGAAHGFSVTNNRITNSGVRMAGNVIISLPLSGEYGILLGGEWDYNSNPVPNFATISGNTVQNSGYVGIDFERMTAMVKNNVVVDSCRVFDDCGGIYTSDKYNNSTIQGNMVINSYGNPDGRAGAYPSFAQGIYLDDYTHGVTVADNTVVNADFTMLVHDSSDNIIRNNTFYGGRRGALWFQENNPDSLNVRNTVTGNIFFPLNNKPHSGISSTVRDVTMTGADRNYFSKNIYGGLYSDFVATIGSPSGNALLTFLQWQDKGADTDGIFFQPFAVGPYRVLSINSGNQITNATFDGNVTGWSTYRGAVAWQKTCGSMTGCAKFTAGSTDGSLISNLYPATQGKQYEISFDIASPAGSFPVGIVMIRSGPTYEVVANPYTQTVSVSPTGRHVNLLFTGVETVSNARFDFDVPAGQSIFVDNAKVTEITAENNTSFVDDSHILLNTQPSTQSLPCPDLNPSHCGAYIDLGGSPISWPVTLAPYSSKIVIGSNNPFKVPGIGSIGLGTTPGGGGGGSPPPPSFGGGTTYAPDSTAPTTPQNVVGTSTLPTQISLSWDPS
ncbi:MAG: right-handed parallel beta-helix repeat-containing protein, partial [Minisyncoccota bacterium]